MDDVPGGAAGVQLPPLPMADPGIRRHYLLALPDGVTAEEIEVLALSRFPSTSWQVTPGASETGRAPRPLPGLLRLSRHTTLTGPYRPGPGDAVSLGLPATTAAVFDVVTPRERGARPYPGGDRDGLKRVFPDGMPIREEERVVQWLVAVARRASGSIRLGEAATVLTPDPDALVDLTIYTATWLDPEDALAVMQRTVPRARLALDGAAWGGPAQPPAPGFLGTDALDDEERRRLHAEADAFDQAALSAPDHVDAYGAVANLGVDGRIVVEVSDEEVVPPILRGLPWTQDGAVAYSVRWVPVDVEALEQEKPPHSHRIARSRASSRLNALVRALHAVVGGEIADDDDFLVAPEDLSA